MPQTILVILTSFLLLIGIFMAILPGIPGILYMFVVALLYGYFDGFTHIGNVDLAILATITVVTLLFDFFSGIVGAKWGGAHWSSIIFGIVGGVFGSVMIPIPIFGSIAGMFLGVLASELYRTKDVKLANRAATASFLGWLAGTGFKILASVLFLILFLIFAIF